MNESPIECVKRLKREFKGATSAITKEQNLLNDHSLNMPERVRITNSIADLCDTRDFVKQQLDIAEHYAVNEGSPIC